MAPGPNFEPMVSRPSFCCGPKSATAPAATSMATIDPGTRLMPSLGQKTMNKTQARASPSDTGWHREVFPNPLQLMEKLAGRRRFGVDSKKINRLRRHDGNRDAGGKTARDRPRNEFDEVAHARKSHGNKKSSGHHRSQDQAGVAVFLDSQQN